MTQLKFHIDASLPATPFVSDTMQGGKKIDIALPEGKRSAIFVQQSTDGTNWTSKQSVSPTNKATIKVFATDTTQVRVLLAERPLSAQYEDFNPGGGSGTVRSVNGVEPDENGNVEITVGGATFATDSDIDALWQ